MSIEKEQHLLILFPGSLGDAVCALPAIEHLSQQHTKNLVLAVRGETFELFSAVSFARTVVSLENRIFSQLFIASTLASEEARRFFSSFSDIVSWYGHTQSQVADNLRLLSSSQVHSFAFFNGQEESHAVAYYLRCVGVDDLKCPSLRIPETALQWQAEYWRRRSWDVAQKTLLLHPGSGGKKKRWSAEGFRSIAAWWQNQQRGKALILLGPVEATEADEWRGVGEIVTELSLWQVMALLSRVNRYVGNDSGVSHLAGAVGAHGVVIFGPTRSQQWRPLGGRLSVLLNVSYRLVHPEAQEISLAEIPVVTVMEKLLECR